MTPPVVQQPTPEADESSGIDHAILDEYAEALFRGDASEPGDWLRDRNLDNPPAVAALQTVALLVRHRQELRDSQAPKVHLSAMSGEPDEMENLFDRLLDDEAWLRDHQLKPLGRLDVEGGGMGQIVLAWHTAMKREVVLKAAIKPQHQERFRREIEVHAKLGGHPNIVVARTPLVYQGVSLLVVDYIAGPDLKRQIVADGPLPWRQASDYVRQAAIGLGHAHRLEVVHRDVKSRNIVRSNRDGVVRVLDWGLALDREARRHGNDESVTMPGQILGTAPYCPPEQANDATAVTAASDLYGLGCVWYELLSGAPPFQGYPAALRHAHAHEPVPPLDPSLGVPERVEHVLRRALDKAPERRYPSAEEFIAALDDAQNEAKTTTDPWGPRWPRRAALGALIALLLGGIYWLWPERPTVLDLAIELSDMGPNPSHSGNVGTSAFGAREGDQVFLRAKFSAPAYWYFLSFRPDGQMELCEPARDDERPQRLVEPKSPRERSVELNDGLGLQAFAVIASRKPLPPFREWRTAQGPPRWKAMPAEPGLVWRFDGERFETLKSGSAPRSAGVTPRGEMGAVAGLADWLKTRQDVDAVYIKAFAVLPPSR
jgi:serine/threonine protein kinase